MSAGTSNVYNLTCNDKEILASHAAFAKELELGIAGAIMDIGPIVLDAVIEALESSIVRPNESQGTLREAIKNYIVTDSEGVVIGIGDIDDMDKTVPYWNLIEDGGMVAARVVPGYFTDESGMVVPFDSSKVPALSGKSMDIFVYTPGGGWAASNELQFGITAESGSATAMPHKSFMFVNRPIMPHLYFYVGNITSRTRVFNILDQAWNRIFSNG